MNEERARLVLMEQTLAFLEAFVASVSYHDEHDADGFVRTMQDARAAARLLIERLKRATS